MACEPGLCPEGRALPDGWIRAAPATRHEKRRRPVVESGALWPVAVVVAACGGGIPAQERRLCRRGMGAAVVRCVAALLVYDNPRFWHVS